MKLTRELEDEMEELRGMANTVSRRVSDEEARLRRQLRDFADAERAKVDIRIAQLRNRGVSIRNIGVHVLGTQNFNTAKEAIARGMRHLELLGDVIEPTPEPREELASTQGELRDIRFEYHPETDTVTVEGFDDVREMSFNPENGFANPEQDDLDQWKGALVAHVLSGRYSREIQAAITSVREEHKKA